jgi:hypoxanthine phosphoribosyltransferase
MNPTPEATDNPLYDEIGRVLLRRHEIAFRVQQLGREIAAAYQGRELTILAVMTGSIMFLADLMRNLPLRMRLDVMGASSYAGASTESTGPEIVLPPRSSLAGHHVLLMDDILDTGQTLAEIARRCRADDVASLKTCVLLAKQDVERQADIQPDFVGFEVPNLFVVGYGLDYNHLYRNLPDICALRPEAMQEQR